MNLHKYSVDELKSAAETSINIRGALIKLGVKPYGGNYQIFKKACETFDIDTSHFKGKLSQKGVPTGRTPKTKIELIEILAGKHPQYGTSKLSKRLIKEGIFEHKCSCCGGTEWMGEQIPIELDHINGINNDHRLENLRLLCPNCHAQTDTYCGKNQGRKKLH